MAEKSKRSNFLRRRHKPSWERDAAKARQTPDIDWERYAAKERQVSEGAGQPPLRVSKPVLKRVAVKPPIMRKRPTVRGGIPLPAGAVGAAVSVARAVVGRMRGSPVTGPTKVARMSQAASAPSAAYKPLVRKPTVAARKPVLRRSGMTIR